MNNQEARDYRKDKVRRDFELAQKREIEAKQQREQQVRKLIEEEAERKRLAESEAKAAIEWKAKQEQGGSEKCLICFEDVAAKDMVFAPCKHNYCNECWQGYLNVKIKEGQVLKLSCPAPSCKRSVKEEEVHGRTSAEMYKKYQKYLYNAQMSLNPNARWCPTPDCETVMVGDKKNPRLKCPTCSKELCFLCNKGWRIGSCDMAARGILSVAADRTAFAAYALVTNLKECPACRAPTMRDGGCNHMSCSRCGHQWCWMCKGDYNSNHFAWWNLWGCPAAQEGGLACLGDDRFFCLNCSCGCGLLGKLKRTVMKILYMSCALACCPCLCIFAVYHYVDRHY